MLTAAALVGRLVAAVPVPFDARGFLDEAALERYVVHFDQQSVDGVTVWAHTGRGLHLDPTQRETTLRAWRAGFGGGRPILAAAGAAVGTNSWGHAVDSARRMAEQAAELGADALLVHPPALVREMADASARIVDYHDAIGEVGLPLVLFYLYEAAGGVEYPSAVLRELLARPDVLGIKVATLDRIMMFQDIATLVRGEFPEKVLITGEDRFLGYSLMCGAQAALVGMGAACVGVQAALLDAFRREDWAAFVEASGRVDRLARHTFHAPMEGYIRRMLWCLVHEGVIGPEAAHDPWGPAPDAAEFERLGAVVRALTEEFPA